VPFQSKRQWRAAFSGRIPGISKEKAREWAHETGTPFKKLPGRAASQKGKPTLRSKKSSLGTPTARAIRALRRSKQGRQVIRDALEETQLEGPLGHVPDVLRAHLGREESKTSSLEALVPYFAKLAQLLTSGAPSGALSSADLPPSPLTAPQPTQSARGAGDFTPNRPKKPGMPLRKQVTNPRLRVWDAMNKGVA